MAVSFTSKIYQITLIFLISLISLPQVTSDVYTSSTDLEKMLITAKGIPKMIDIYIKYEEERLQSLREYGNNFTQLGFSNISDDELYLSHPINIFHLMKQVKSKLTHLIDLMQMTSFDVMMVDDFFQDYPFIVPTETDMIGVSTALGRIIHAYKLSVSSLANGKINSKFKSEIKLSASECFKVGNDLYQKDLISQALPWFEEALKKESMEATKTIDISFLYSLLTDCLKKVGNNTQALVITKSWLKEVPNDLDASLNLKSLELVPDEESTTAPLLAGDGEPLGEEGEQIWNTYYALCRNETIRNTKKEKLLKCYYMTNKSPFLVIQPIKVEDMNKDPWVAVFYDILFNHEIEDLKKMSFPVLIRSQIGKKQNEAERPDYRISKIAWIDNDRLLIDKINHRLEEITGLVVVGGSEDLQVNDYGLGGHYEPHFDYLTKRSMAPEREHLGNRIATVLFYMNDVISGGATVFPGLNIAIWPKKGSAAFWYNMNKIGYIENLSQHGSCPVLIGKKWVANKWIREYPQMFRRPCIQSLTDLYYYHNN